MRTKAIEMEGLIAKHVGAIRMVAEGHSTEWAENQLLIMEQVLTEMRRFLINLEQHAKEYDVDGQWRRTTKGKQMRLFEAPTTGCATGRHKTKADADPISNELLLDDVDIQQAAEAAVQQHGDSVPTFCARKLADMLDRDDMKRAATWLAIQLATKSLLDDLGEQRNPDLVANIEAARWLSMTVTPQE